MAPTDRTWKRKSGKEMEDSILASMVKLGVVKTCAHPGCGKTSDLDRRFKGGFCHDHQNMAEKMRKEAEKLAERQREERLAKELDELERELDEAALSDLFGAWS